LPPVLPSGDGSSSKPIHTAGRGRRQRQPLRRIPEPSAAKGWVGNRALGPFRGAARVEPHPQILLKTRKDRVWKGRTNESPAFAGRGPQTQGITIMSGTKDTPDQASDAPNPVTNGLSKTLPPNPLLLGEV